MGWVAAVAVLILLASSYLLLVVAAGGEGVPKADDEDLIRAAEEIRHELELSGQPPVAPTFSDTAENYFVSMAPSLQMIAKAVVQRAELGVNERVLDAGTGTGFGAAAALWESRSVVGVDADADMLGIAHREVPGAHFVEAEIAAVPFDADWFHAVISVHALQFADDPAAVLAEWRRVTLDGGRLSLSVPGPRSTLSINLYDPVYRRYGIKRSVQVATGGKLSTWARAAGWQQIKVVADPLTVIRLAGPDAFQRWLRAGSRSHVGGAQSAASSEALERELLAATPTTPDGQLQIPFGTLYLTALNIPEGTGACRTRPVDG